ncbi:MAG: hypothetical protein WCD16_11490, partial [Paracoccaceae bacterium]
GDIFYLHARMLERAAKLSEDLGGGSLTALPIAETDAGNLSAYIPTNLISITDGQIVLDSHLFAANQRPAVNVGLSVSRVGGKTQRKDLRQVAGPIRLDYSQFQELEMFTRFGGLSDSRVRDQITRGERIRALLAQPRFTDLRPVDQLALLHALRDGVLDSVPPEVVPELRAKLPDWLDSRAQDIVAAITEGEMLDDAGRDRLLDAVRALAAEVAPESDTDKPDAKGAAQKAAQTDKAEETEAVTGGKPPAEGAGGGDEDSDEAGQ